MKKKNDLMEWEIQVCFKTSRDKDNDEFMELIEDKIYAVIDEIAPESDEMSVLRVNLLAMLK